MEVGEVRRERDGLEVDFGRLGGGAGHWRRGAAGIDIYSATMTRGHLLGLPWVVELVSAIVGAVWSGRRLLIGT